VVNFPTIAGVAISVVGVEDNRTHLVGANSSGVVAKCLDPDLRCERVWCGGCHRISPLLALEDNGNKRLDH
jgi:hypothetical protein